MAKVRHGDTRIVALEKKAVEASKNAAKSSADAKVQAAKAAAARKKAAAATRASAQALAVRSALNKVKKKALATKLLPAKKGDGVKPKKGAVNAANVKDVFEKKKKPKRLR